MDEQGIIKNIRRLSFFIDDAYLKSENDKYFIFKSDFVLFHKQVEIVYEKWFPNSKPCKDETIANIIFTNKIENKDAKNWVKYSMACLLKSSTRVYENILQAKQNNNENLFVSELRFLKEISYEASFLLEIGFQVMEEKAINFGNGKRFQIYPRETFDASKNILRKYLSEDTIGNYVISPTSIFLIRQSIELWLLSIFGISHVRDNKDNLKILQPERLFELIDNEGKKVELPVAKAVIQKIHKWTQMYVHGGVMAYSWEIEHAQYVLQPIFYSKNVKIDQAHFDSVEDKLKVILKDSLLKLYRMSGHNSMIKNKVSDN